MGMKTMPATPSTNPHYTSRQRVTLLILEAVAGISAVGGGIGLIGGWLDISTSHLDGTPFNSYVIPGLILLFVVGGLLLTAAWTVWSDGRFALEASLAAGFMLLGWFSVQIMMIGLLNWLQPLFAAIGVVIAVIAVAASRR